MPETQQPATFRQCPTCRKEYPADTLVCPTCRAILVEPDVRPCTPGWVIGLLVALALALLAYAAYLAWQVFALHNF